MKKLPPLQAISEENTRYLLQTIQQSDIMKKYLLAIVAVMAAMLGISANPVLYLRDRMYGEG